MPKIHLWDGVTHGISLKLLDPAYIYHQEGKILRGYFGKKIAFLA